MFDWKKPTVQMLGRWQPWHDGHQELFKRAVKKTGQVIIQVRDVHGASGVTDRMIILLNGIRSVKIYQKVSRKMDLKEEKNTKL